jgi:arylsulfatase A-like enzyme
MLAAALALNIFSFTGCNPDRDEPGQRKPNVILIVADDLGYGDLSCYGQKTLKTPHIDQMAAEGILLANHYTGSTVCAPSRASLLTGKHPGHVTVRGNYAGMLLGEEEVTIGDIFKQGGYVTGAVGKWGVGHPPPPDDPEKNGFDHFYGYINMWHAHNFYPEFLYRNGQKVKLEGNRTLLVDGVNPWINEPEGTGVASEKVTYVHDLFDTEGLEFIEKHKDTAFFLYMAYNVPHANNEAGYMFQDGMEVPDYGSYKEMDWPDPEKGFAAMIENLDRSVGLIHAKLEELNLAENTLVIFVSDNGPHEEGNHSAEFFDSNGILRGTKRDLYEGGIRTPFIARWPGTIAAGSTSGHVSAFWDMLPTFCEIAGVNIPAESDGISFLPTLKGQPDEQEKHPFLYFEFYEQGGKQSILLDQWKGVKLEVRSGNPKPTELYNLAEDPSESVNLADSYPEIVATMDSLMALSHSPLEGISLFNEEREADMAF